MKVVAIDTETCLIGYPDQVNPDMVCLSYSLSNTTDLIHVRDQKRLKTFLQDILSDHHIVGHNIAFDLHVILKVFPDLWPAVWKALRESRVYDTMLRERLMLLASAGDTSAKPCSLADLVKRYIGDDISALKGEDAWRMRYGELADVALVDWPTEAVDYAKSDAEYTLRVFHLQEHLHKESFVSQDLQVAAAFALRGMEINGIRIDLNSVEMIRQDMEGRLEPLVAKLRRAGIIREDGSQDKKLLQRYARKWGVTEVTKTGATSTSMKILKQLQCSSTIYRTYMEYASMYKAVTTFLPQMSFDRIHPRYNPIINTLRTSCMASQYYKTGDGVPSINLQQIPRDARFRQAFIPEDGMMFVCADYANLELVCAAQTYYNTVGYSKMLEVLNTGENLHTFLGRTIYNDMFGHDITLEEYKSLLNSGDKDAKMARQSAKPVNLGCPGGQSASTIQRTAQEIYGMPVSLEQATKWRDIARGMYSEIDVFFEKVLPTFQTPRGMYVKTDEGMKYTQRYDIVAYGVRRAKCTYCAAANGFCMQTPGALGKKLALVEAYERCTNPDRMSNMYGSIVHIDMHDELLLSAPSDIIKEVEEELAECMLESMQKVCPDMRVATESMIMKRWGKDPESGRPSKEFHLEPGRVECKQE